MLLSRKKDRSAVSYFLENELRTLVVSKKNLNIDVDYAHSSILDPKDIVSYLPQHPEKIIEALKKQFKGVDVKKVQLLLPYHVFEYVHLSVEKTSDFRQDIHDLKARIQKETAKRKDEVLVYRYDPKQKSDMVRTLVFISKERFDAFSYVFKKAGKTLDSIKPDIFSLSPVLKKHKNNNWIHVDSRYIHFFSFNNGVLKNHKSFDLGYESFIKTHASCGEFTKDESICNIKQDALLARNNEVLSKKFFTLIKPLLRFLKSQEKEKNSAFFVSFDHYKVAGLVDVFKKDIHKNSQYFDVYKEFSSLVEVLAIPRDELDQFQFLLAEAVYRIEEVK